MNPIGSLILSEDAIPLSESLRATVSLDSVAPFTVTVPNPLLSEVSRTAWFVKPLGKPVLAKLLDGQERWTQTFALEPRVPGESVSVEFAAFVVTSAHGDAATVTLPVKTVAVKSSGTTAESESRPVTPPEPLRDDSHEKTPAYFVPVTLLALSFVVVLLAIAWRRFIHVRSPDPPYDPESDLNRIANLEGDRDFADGLGKLIRLKLDPRFASMTTAEIATVQPGPHVQLLERCDRVLFAGERFEPEDRVVLLADARSLIANPANAPKPTR